MAPGARWYLAPSQNSQDSQALLQSQIWVHPRAPKNGYRHQLNASTFDVQIWQPLSKILQARENDKQVTKSLALLATWIHDTVCNRNMW